ncbi:MAG TPA: hypothetical protein VGQ59_05800 [Cyclobacteriaceae bacterium]|jgi:hypothetical protein|nr:hypothetical protein [Cyclobacteriaceae bacterium]
MKGKLLAVFYLTVLSLAVTQCNERQPRNSYYTIADILKGSELNQRTNSKYFPVSKIDIDVISASEHVVLIALRDFKDSVVVARMELMDFLVDDDVNKSFKIGDTVLVHWYMTNFSKLPFQIKSLDKSINRKNKVPLND